MQNSDLPTDNVTHTVVMNDEMQYSIWPVNRVAPVGWSEVGVTGSKQTCLEYIAKVWTDMRPKSVRAFMDGTRDAS